LSIRLYGYGGIERGCYGNSEGEKSDSEGDSSNTSGRLVMAEASTQDPSKYSSESAMRSFKPNRDQADQPTPPDASPHPDLA